MNIFNKIMETQSAAERTLGNPLSDLAAKDRRLTYFMHLRGGKGFRQMPKEPKKDAQGRTRGDRKKAMREVANDKARVQ